MSNLINGLCRVSDSRSGRIRVKDDSRDDAVWKVIDFIKDRATSDYFYREILEHVDTDALAEAVLWFLESGGSVEFKNGFPFDVGILVGALADPAEVGEFDVDAILQDAGDAVSDSAPVRVKDSIDPRAYNVIDALVREGLTNSDWGLCRDVESESYFGVEEGPYLEGAWVYVYCPVDEQLTYLKEEPDYILSLDEDEEIRLFAL